MIMNPKQKVAAKAIEQIESGMLVGLGTGSTANFFIDALAAQQQENNLSVDVVSSSVITSIYARQQGLNLIGIDQVSTLDLYVDGADEVSPALELLKGRGQDLVKEKLLASGAAQFIVLVDESKLVTAIGDKNPIPIEVLPEALLIVQAQLEQLDIESSVRSNDTGGAWFSAAGNLILDLNIQKVNAIELNQILGLMPGVVEHGIFIDLASTVLVGKETGVEILQS
jgi:ribose 5-phosphate isomerase A